MRPEGNPLDLNNLPEDYGKVASVDSSSSSAVYRKKKSGAKEGKDEMEKVYECRFCSLKFGKSQALGGHMNRHRQERETETLNKARQLVFTNDLAPSGHLGYVSNGQPIPHGSMGEAGLPYRPMYSTRLFPPPPPPPPQSAYVYPTPPRMLSFHSQYPGSAAAAPVSDYFVGNMLSNQGFGGAGNNYACVGEPVGQGFGSGGGGGGGGVRDITLQRKD